MKKRIFIVLSALVLVCATSSDLTLSTQVVNDFYRSLEIIARDPDGNAYQDAVEKCSGYCQSEVMATFPNEYKLLGYNSANTDKDLIGRNYISSFGKFMRNKPSRFVVSSVSAPIPYYQAEWKKSASRASFVYFIVDKSYGGTSFRDTVLLDGHQKIIGIRNRAGGNAYTSTISSTSSNSTTSTTSTTTGSGGISIQELELRASVLYTKKDFTQAYSLYKDILTYDKENVNANYRLAIMSYKREGCGHLSKKEADRVAMNYLLRARNYANKANDRENVEKFDNILYYWN